MQRFIGPGTALAWFEMLLKGETERSMESCASGLTRYFQEVTNQAKHVDEVPPIPGEPEGTVISVERARELFNTLHCQDDLPTIQFCVSMLHRFMRQHIKRIQDAGPTAVAA